MQSIQACLRQWHVHCYCCCYCRSMRGWPRMTVLEKKPASSTAVTDALHPVEAVWCKSAHCYPRSGNPGLKIHHCHVEQFGLSMSTYYTAFLPRTAGLHHLPCRTGKCARTHTHKHTHAHTHAHPGGRGKRGAWHAFPRRLVMKCHCTCRHTGCSSRQCNTNREREREKKREEAHAPVCASVTLTVSAKVIDSSSLTSTSLPPSRALVLLATRAASLHHSSPNPRANPITR